MKDIEAADTYMERLLEFCPKIGRAHIQSRLDVVAAERAREENGSRRNSELARWVLPGICTWVLEDKNDE